MTGESPFPECVALGWSVVASGAHEVSDHEVRKEPDQAWVGAQAGVTQLGGCESRDAASHNLDQRVQ
jgi:hypothetical protein